MSIGMIWLIGSFITLNISDSYNWGEPELEELIFRQVTEKLGIS